jgi:hypothetical protein
VYERAFIVLVRIDEATIIHANTIHIMWMGNIEYEGDNLMLVDE